MPVDDGLIELSAYQDFLTDGPARIEVLREDTARIVYFSWRIIDGTWRRVVADYARICPISSLHFPITSIPGVKIVVRGRQQLALHS